jgi:hypothetical protein
MYTKSNPILIEIQDELAVIGEMKTVKFLWALVHARVSVNKKALSQCLPPQWTLVAADMIARAKFNAKKII